jgi:Skp family chaperone for outer membrane proteins
MSFLGLGLLQWTALAAIAGFVLAAAAIATIIVTVCVTQADRRRDDIRRQEDRQWDSDRRQEDREHDAELRRQDREREDRIRREEDEKWRQRRRDERRQREDDDAQEQVVTEFPAASLLSQAPPTVTTGDGITHRIVVTTATAYPIKGIDARIAHRANSGLGILSPGWSFGRPVTENSQVRYTCSAHVPQQVHDAAPIVRFTDRNGNLYYSYLGYTRRFGQNTDWIGAATQLDQWIRTGPKPDEPST